MIGFHLAPPHVRNNASSEGKPLYILYSFLRYVGILYLNRIFGEA